MLIVNTCTQCQESAHATPPKHSARNLSLYVMTGLHGCASFMLMWLGSAMPCAWTQMPCAWTWKQNQNFFQEREMIIQWIFRRMDGSDNGMQFFTLTRVWHENSFLAVIYSQWFTISINWNGIRCGIWYGSERKTPSIFVVRLVRLFLLCLDSSFVNIKYKWAFHKCVQNETMHTAREARECERSFLKYKWTVNSVMMLSHSIYSCTILWQGFYLYGHFYTSTWGSTEAAHWHTQKMLDPIIILNSGKSHP